MDLVSQESPEENLQQFLTESSLFVTPALGWRYIILTQYKEIITLLWYK